MYFPAPGAMALAVTNAMSPYSFVVPPNVTVIWVEAWGPGGGGSGGGGGASNNQGGGGAGASGQAGIYVFAPMLVTPGETLTVTVPAGGAGGAGGAADSDGSDGTDASDTTVAGASQTITAKGGRGTQIVTGTATPRGKKGTASAGSGGTALTATTVLTGAVGAIAMSALNGSGNATSGTTNASGGGGGQGNFTLGSIPVGASVLITTAAANPSGTTGGTAATSTINASRSFLNAPATIVTGAGGNGNGTNPGTQGTDTSATIGFGGPGGGGGGGNGSGTAGAGADGRQGGSGYVILYYIA